MENKSNLQLELFQSEDAARINPRADNPYFSFLKSYEKTLLLIIGVAVTGIISFSLGVEKGKQISTLKDDYRLDVAQRVKNAAAPAQIYRQPPAISQEQDNKEKEIDTREKQRYVIQLASYKGKKNAQKEMEALKRQGIPAVIIPKGNYIVLYAGNFSTKLKAESLLSQLKKRYKDCQLRRRL